MANNASPLELLHQIGEIGIYNYCHKCFQMQGFQLCLLQGNPRRTNGTVISKFISELEIEMLNYPNVQFLFVQFRVVFTFSHNSIAAAIIGCSCTWLQRVEPLLQAKRAKDLWNEASDFPKLVCLLQSVAVSVALSLTVLVECQS